MNDRDALWQGLGAAVGQLRREALEQLNRPRQLIGGWLARLLRRIP